jgi:glycosyltransferase involved in cell wall biosynthesis
MNIWIITTGEPIPFIDGKNIRPWRSILLTDMLLSKGHNVIRWAGTFDHSIKTNRYNSNKLILVNNQYKIQLFYSGGYNKNISIKRLLDHKEGADNFKKLIYKEEKPDLILCSMPTLELCHVSVEYANKFNIPVVLDIRDLWPDIFLDIAPSFLKPILRILLKKYYSILKYSCYNATAISGISSEYVQWGINYSLRKKTEYDKFFPHGYMQTSISESDSTNAELFWRSFNFICENDFIICLFSSLGNVIDIAPIIEASIRFEKEGMPVKFILCGEGVKLNEFKRLTNRYKNILLPGWIDKNQIHYLMKISKLGILPYKNLGNYQLNIPNKPIEYLSAGLPVITSVSGLLKNTIDEFECGKFYSIDIKFDLYYKILCFYNDPEMLRLYSKNALSLYHSQFDSNKVYRNMAEYLENIKYNFDETI